MENGKAKKKGREEKEVSTFAILIFGQQYAVT